HHRRVAVLGAHVVPGGEGVLGVDAHPEPLAVPRLGDEPGELVEADADLRPLPCGVLERDRGWVAAARAQCLAERVRGSSETCRLPCSAVRARMRDEVGYAEPRAALELVVERARGAAAERLVGRCGVEEVAVVREDRADAAGGACRREGPDIVLAERPSCPLARRAGEELDGGAAGRAPALERTVEAPGDRLVRPEERHVVMIAVPRAARFRRRPSWKATIPTDSHSPASGRRHPAAVQRRTTERRSAMRGY